MAMRGRFWAPLLGPLLVVLAVLVWLAPGGMARGEDAEALIRQGNELRRAGQDEEALPLFARAYAVAPAPRTRALLGLAQAATGRWLDAEASLQGALAAAADPWIQRRRGDLDS